MVGEDGDLRSGSGYESRSMVEDWWSKKIGGLTRGEGGGRL